jgi:hypothetical protein
MLVGTAELEMSGSESILGLGRVVAVIGVKDKIEGVFNPRPNVPRALSEVIRAFGRGVPTS